MKRFTFLLTLLLLPLAVLAGNDAYAPYGWFAGTHAGDGSRITGLTYGQLGGSFPSSQLTGYSLTNITIYPSSAGATAFSVRARSDSAASIMRIYNKDTTLTLDISPNGDITTFGVFTGNGGGLTNLPAAASKPITNWLSAMSGYPDDQNGIMVRAWNTGIWSRPPIASQSWPHTWKFLPGYRTNVVRWGFITTNIWQAVNSYVVVTTTLLYKDQQITSIGSQNVVVGSATTLGQTNLTFASYTNYANNVTPCGEYLGSVGFAWPNPIYTSNYCWYVGAQIEQYP